MEEPRLKRDSTRGSDIKERCQYEVTSELIPTARSTDCWVAVAKYSLSEDAFLLRSANSADEHRGALIATAKSFCIAG